MASAWVGEIMVVAFFLSNKVVCVDSFSSMERSDWWWSYLGREIMIEAFLLTGRRTTNCSLSRRGEVIFAREGEGVCGIALYQRRVSD